ncbi:MAG: hypothetical protein ACI9M3_002139 [Bacteroidia bacterium]|jgi:hypothetical protein
MNQKIAMVVRIPLGALMLIFGINKIRWLYATTRDFRTIRLSN